MRVTLVIVSWNSTCGVRDRLIQAVRKLFSPDVNT